MSWKMLRELVLMNEIRKIGAIILTDKRILVAKKKHRFIIPGGKVEEGESPIDCLRRELKEELGVNLVSQEFFGRFEDSAALDPGMKIKMEVYVVDIMGEPKASSEIEDLAYINSKNMNDVALGSILEKFVIPELLKRRLID
jgi:8-oxo-dGTP pyrophosphatase MutT (NUDIX family)